MFSGKRVISWSVRHDVGKSEPWFRFEIEAKLMTNRERAIRRRAKQEAEDRLSALSPSVPDAEVAEALAVYCVASAELLGTRQIHLQIFHDVGRRSKQGPCPLAFDWSYKNVVGISTDDRDRALRWATEAALKGYGISFLLGRKGAGFSRGSIRSWREQRLAATTQVE
jgi:hypothetical protein